MKPSPDMFDVIVAGLGPVGAAAANFLGARGIRTLVLEKDFEPYTMPRAIHFDHEIMRLFQSAGMADLIVPHVYSPAGAMHFGAHYRPIRQFQPNVRTDRFGWPSANYFYQPELEAVLRSALEDRPTVSIRPGCEVTQVAQDDEGVAVDYLCDGKTHRVRGRYLLACDGGRSVIRRSLGIDLDDLDFHEPWMVVDAHVDGKLTLPELHDTPEGVDMQQVLFIMGDPKRPTSVIPGIGRHRRWEFMLLPDETAEDYADGSRAARLVAPFVTDASFELIRCAVYTFHALVAEQWQSDRIFLVGDSAHQTPPFFGQGLCHGIRDAANLTWKLDMVLRGDAPPALLTTYQPERDPQVRGVIDLSVRAGRAICTLDPEVAQRRDEAMTAAARLPAPDFVDPIPSLNGGLISHAARKGVGARFMQPPVSLNGCPRQLLDDATGGGFVLLARSGAAPGAGRRPLAGSTGIALFRIGEDLADLSGELDRWLAHHDCAGVILRPDFYVFGTFDDAAGAEALIDELRARLQTPAVANS